MSEVLFSGRFLWEVWSEPRELFTADAPWYQHYKAMGNPPMPRQLLDSGEFSNGIITASIDDLFDTYFDNGTTETAWFAGLIDEVGFSALSPTDTMASHAGWTELEDYSEGTRPAWAAGPSASGVKTNPTRVVYTATADISVKGIFVISNSTKGGSTGKLWSHGALGTTKDISTGQQFRAFYELRGRQG